MGSVRICAILIVIAAIVTAIDLPSNYRKCGRKDANLATCLKEAGTLAIRNLKNGLPEFGIVPIDPIIIKSLELIEGEGSPISLTQKFKNLTIYGLSDLEILSVRANPEKCKYVVDATVKEMELFGDYEINGKILLLPIVGKGKSNVTMYNNLVRCIVNCEIFKKPDGKSYLRSNDFKVEMNFKNVKVNFENLFNGDKALSDNMNKFINENWELVFNEVKPGYEDAFGKLFQGILNNIATNVPEDVLFLN